MYLIPESLIRLRSLLASLETTHQLKPMIGGLEVFTIIYNTLLLQLLNIVVTFYDQVLKLTS
jgi:hypothetical protein